MSEKKWFKAKRYGYGWYPASKEGWLATVGFGVFVAGLGLCFGLLAEDLEAAGSERLVLLIILYFSAVLSAIYAFMQLALKRGEKPSWRWGNKK